MYILFILVILPIILAKREQNRTKTSVVINLNDTSFDHFISSNDYVMVKFFVPWCIHCKTFAPVYARAARALKKDNIILAEMDCTKNKQINRRFKLRTYPTIKFFYKGKMINYEGTRGEFQIIEWAKEQATDLVQEIKTAQQIEEYTNKYDSIVVYFGDNKEELIEFEMTARENQKYYFYVCNNLEVSYNLDRTQGNIMLFKAYDEKNIMYTGSVDKEELKKFINEYSYPLIMNFDEKAARRILGDKIPGMILFRDENDKDASRLDAILRETAKYYRGKIQMISTDIKGGMGLNMGEFVQVFEEDLPAIKMLDTRDDLDRYSFVKNGRITAEQIINFISDWEKGKLEKDKKSEKIPKVQTTKAYKLVAASFKNEVINSNKDVLVLYYASWCKHSQKLLPIYEELAAKYSKCTDLLIGKMDATLNEIQSIELVGYPTVYLFKQGKKDKPIEFDDDRTLLNLEKFLLQNCEFSKNCIESIQSKKQDL